MSLATILEERFSGSVADDPITEADIERFEQSWGRAVPQVLRTLLLEVNGIIFDPEVEFRGLSRVVLLSLAGMDSVLRNYGEYAYSFLIPFAGSLTCGAFFLDARENNSEVFHLTPVAEFSPDRIVLEKVAVNLEAFVSELQVSDEE